MNKPKTTITAWPLNDDWNSATGSWSRNTCYSEVAAEYTMSSHVDALIAEARDAALVEAAGLCEVVHTDRINRGSLRIGAGWFEIRDAILALRTTDATSDITETRTIDGDLHRWTDTPPPLDDI